MPPKKKATKASKKGKKGAQTADAPEASPPIIQVTNETTPQPPSDQNKPVEEARPSPVPVVEEAPQPTMLIDTCQGGANPILDSVPMVPQLREGSEQVEADHLPP